MASSSNFRIPDRWGDQPGGRVSTLTQGRSAHIPSDGMWGHFLIGFRIGRAVRVLRKPPATGGGGGQFPWFSQDG